MPTRLAFRKLLLVGRLLAGLVLLAVCAGLALTLFKLAFTGTTFNDVTSATSAGVSFTAQAFLVWRILLVMPRTNFRANNRPGTGGPDLLGALVPKPTSPTLPSLAAAAPLPKF